jgi:hypothetical protein
MPPEWQPTTAEQGCVVRAMAQLILKCASASRPCGEWNADDFDVLADGAVVGRISRPMPRR